jgi:hypothetical protein
MVQITETNPCGTLLWERVGMVTAVRELLPSRARREPPHQNAIREWRMRRRKDGR